MAMIAYTKNISCASGHCLTASIHIFADDSFIVLKSNLSRLLASLKISVFFKPSFLMIDKVFGHFFSKYSIYSLKTSLEKSVCSKNHSRILRLCCSFCLKIFLSSFLIISHFSFLPLKSKSLFLVLRSQSSRLFLSLLPIMTAIKPIEEYAIAEGNLPIFLLSGLLKKPTINKIRHTQNIHLHKRFGFLKQSIVWVKRFFILLLFIISRSLEKFGLSMKSCLYLTQPQGASCIQH